MAGIEFIRNKNGEIFTYDVNTNTNYNADAEKAAGRFGMLELATLLGHELVKVSEKRYTLKSKQKSLRRLVERPGFFMFKRRINVPLMR